MNDQIFHAGVSGGKDSDALLLWLVHESGIPKHQIKASFCDTGNEADETYAHIAMLHDKVHPIDMIKPPLDFYELAVKKKRFPGAKSRFCTVELKIKPSIEYVKSLMADGSEVIALSGVRASESFERSQLPEREWSDMWDCEVWRPLLHWSLQDVWDIHERYGIPRNPLYDKGCKRVGCLPCIMSRKEEVFTINRQFPERIARIRDAEDATAHDERGGSSFFPSDKVPMRYRSRVWESPEKPAPKKPKKAKPNKQELQESMGQISLMDVEKPAPLPKPKRFHAIAMIDDVVKWAESEYSVHQELLNYEDLEEPPSCSSKWGMCE